GSPHGCSAHNANASLTLPSRCYGMRRPAFLVAAVIALAATPAANASANSCLSPHSWVGGSAWLCRGALVYGDYVDDDFGADTGAFDSTGRTASLAPSAGDQTYPSSHDDGTAD